MFTKISNSAKELSLVASLWSRHAPAYPITGICQVCSVLREVIQLGEEARRLGGIHRHPRQIGFILRSWGLSFPPVRVSLLEKALRQPVIAFDLDAPKFVDDSASQELALALLVGLET